MKDMMEISKILKLQNRRIFSGFSSKFPTWGNTQLMEYNETPVTMMYILAMLNLDRESINASALKKRFFYTGRLCWIWIDNMHVPLLLKTNSKIPHVGMDIFQLLTELWLFLPNFYLQYCNCTSSVNFMESYSN